MRHLANAGRFDTPLLPALPAPLTRPISGTIGRSSSTVWRSRTQCAEAGAPSSPVQVARSSRSSSVTQPRARRPPRRHRRPVVVASSSSPSSSDRARRAARPRAIVSWVRSAGVSATIRVLDVVGLAVIQLLAGPSALGTILALVLVITVVVARRLGGRPRSTSAARRPLRVDGRRPLLDQVRSRRCWALLRRAAALNFAPPRRRLLALGSVGAGVGLAGRRLLRQRLSCTSAPRRRPRPLALRHRRVHTVHRARPRRAQAAAAEAASARRPPRPPAAPGQAPGEQVRSRDRAASVAEPALIDQPRWMKRPARRSPRRAWELHKCSLEESACTGRPLSEREVSLRTWRGGSRGPHLRGHDVVRSTPTATSTSRSAEADRRPVHLARPAGETATSRACSAARHPLHRLRRARVGAMHRPGQGLFRLHNLPTPAYYHAHGRDGHRPRRRARPLRLPVRRQALPRRAAQSASRSAARPRAGARRGARAALRSTSCSSSATSAARRSRSRSSATRRSAPIEIARDQFYDHGNKYTRGATDYFIRPGCRPSAPAACWSSCCARTPRSAAAARPAST